MPKLSLEEVQSHPLKWHQVFFHEEDSKVLVGVNCYWKKDKNSIIPRNRISKEAIAWLEQTFGRDKPLSTMELIQKHVYPLSPEEKDILVAAALKLYVDAMSDRCDPEELFDDLNVHPWEDKILTLREIAQHQHDSFWLSELYGDLK